MRTLLVRQEGGRCIDCIVRTPLILWMRSRLRGASIESENPEPEKRSSWAQTGIINPNRTFNILCTLTQFKRKQENFSFLCHPDLWFLCLKLRSFSHSRFEFDPLHFGLQRLQITAKSWDSTTALLVWALSRQSSWWRGEGSPFVEAFCRELLLLTAVLGHLKTCYK